GPIVSGWWYTGFRSLTYACPCGRPTRMRPSFIIGTAISGVVVALGIGALIWRGQEAPAQPGIDPTTTGRQPAFYLDATPERRRVAGAPRRSDGGRQCRRRGPGPDPGHGSRSPGRRGPRAPVARQRARPARPPPCGGPPRQARRSLGAGRNPQSARSDRPRSVGGSPQPRRQAPHRVGSPGPAPVPSEGDRRAAPFVPPGLAAHER